MRNSKQRELIFEAVQQNLCHPSADYIYNFLKKDHPNLSLATVYRNLNKLADMGVIQKIEVPNGSDRFDAIMSTHIHAMCTQCGEVFDIPEVEGTPIHDAIMNMDNLRDVTGYNLLVHCHCQSCVGMNKAIS